MSDQIPSSNLMGAGNVANCYPRYIYRDELDSHEGTLFDASAETRVHGIRDVALSKAQALYGESVTKDDLFFYIYGILHSPEYRQAFSADFKRDVPRIPNVSSPDEFLAFSTAGRLLSDLHVGYETVEPWPHLEVSYSDQFDVSKASSYAVEKLRYAKRGREVDRTTIVYNSKITISNIPLETYEYTIGSKPALDWIVERYQVKTDKASGIVSDPNDWSADHDDPTYIFDLVRRIVTVSIRTNDIVAGLPNLNL
jgi:predicted helicase